MRKVTSRLMLFPVLLPAVWLLSGCSDNVGKKPKLRKVQGLAKSINIEKRIVSMTFTDDRGRERELEGTFTDKTEVLINGRTQEIQDIRPGDKVLVYGYREGKGADQKLIATKVVVDRPRGADWKPTGQGAGKSPSPSGKKKG